MRSYIYPAIFSKERNGYSVFFPDLEGCHTEGDTIEQALYMAKDALALYIYDYEEEKKILPVPSNPSDLKLGSNEFLAIIDFDMIEYRKKYDKKSVKKTLSIPNWLNTMAEKENINFSQVLQNALQDKLGLITK